MERTHTKGNVIIQEIKIGDIHYEYEYGLGIECEVISLPQKDDEGRWTWESRNVKTGKIINYMVTEGLAHYGPNLYDHKAYEGVRYI